MIGGGGSDGGDGRGGVTTSELTHRGAQLTPWACASPTGCLSGPGEGCRWGCRWAADELTRLGEELDESVPVRREPGTEIESERNSR